MNKIEDILNNISTPIYVCEERLLERNLKILNYVQENSKAKILVALKGFAMWSMFGLVKKYLNGASASGLWEARLSYEELGLETHTYSPAFKTSEIEEISLYSSHLIFNSFNQLLRNYEIAKRVNPSISLGIRVNPQYSKAPKELYNPCASFSRLGVVLDEFREDKIGLIEGLHFHALCEEDSFALQEILTVFEKKFSKYIKFLKWINFGGGHHITKSGYDIEHLIYIIKEFKKRYDVEVYLEPGEAVGLETGVLICEVVDIIKNGMKIAIVDVSAEAHMPDVLAMPYRPTVRGGDFPQVKKYTYRIGGNSCLAGDIIGDYSFDEPLKIGQKLIFEDMIHYTFVKNTTFNGLKLPSLGVLGKDGVFRTIKEFSYCDYKNRLS